MSYQLPLHNIPGYFNYEQPNHVIIGGKINIYRNILLKDVYKSNIHITYQSLKDTTVFELKIKDFVVVVMD